jgi:biotin-(acetyl-CoA carboxylase) ligase
LIKILAAFEHQLKMLELINGPELLRQELLKNSATVGQQVRVEQPKGELIGQAVDLEPSGSLVVQNAQGRHVVSTGDVIHLRSV